MSKFEEYLQKQNESIVLSSIAAGTIGYYLYQIIKAYNDLWLSSKRDIKSERNVKEFLNQNGYNDLGFKLYTLNIEGVSNAFTIGDYIFFTEEMLAEDFTNEELMAIAIHEYGHYLKRHTYITFIRRNAFILLALTIASGMGSLFYSIMAFFLLMNAGNITNTIMSKEMEIEADNIAVKLGMGDILVSALKKLYYQPESKISTFIYKILSFFEEHPSLETRIKKILLDIKVYKYPQYAQEKIIKELGDETV